MYIASFRGVQFMQSSGQSSVALERTLYLVTVEYKEKRKSQCTAPDKMLLFHVKIIVVALSVAALGRLKKEEENSIFNPCWFAALESFASMFCLFLIITLFGKQCFIHKLSYGFCKHKKPKLWRGETNSMYITESMILEDGSFSWGWEFPGCPTLCMKRWYM